jgi:tRNA 2-thiouridine synthesizing protein A
MLGMCHSLTPEIETFSWNGSMPAALSDNDELGIILMLSGFAGDTKISWKISKRREMQMAIEKLDMLGVRCPHPVLKIAVKAPEMAPGDILEVLGDCPTFEKDVRAWCQRLGKICLSIMDEGENKKRIQIQF